jgi:23S rRNA (adenine2503-C2)-methyltransferase
MISVHDRPAVEGLAREIGVDRAALRQLRNAFFKKGASREEALASLPAENAAEFARTVEFHALALHSRQDSQLDGATKLLFRTSKGLLIESVILRIASGRTALCVSSQVGCAAHCRFCATGRMGIAQNLTAAEIVDQVAQANQLLHGEGRRVRNVVFMGMGEPLHNEEQLHGALELLASPQAFDLAPRHVVVSTVGIPDAMVRLAKAFPRVRLALSLHSAREEVRQRLMPIAQRHSLGELRLALDEVVTIQDQPVMIEYLLLAGVNDSPADATALIEYFAGLPVHVNLIPFNPIAEAPELVGTPPAERKQFASLLKASGLRVTMRYSLGADIAAACGQLVQHENRQTARSNLRDLTFTPKTHQPVIKG